MADFKLEPSIKAKWLEALRSGNYEQGHGFLKVEKEDSDGDKHLQYCCIGVACEILEANWEDSHLDEDWEGDPHWFIWGSDEMTPDGFWKGITSSWSLLAEGDATMQLSKMNDGNLHEGLNSQTFSEIADYIEENY